MKGVLLEKYGQTLVTFSYGPLHMDEPVLANQQKLTYNSFVSTQDTV